jgi:hypothetical protein
MSNYSELLKSPEWARLRTIQFDKANNICKHCEKEKNWDFDAAPGEFYAIEVEQDELEKFLGSGKLVYLKVTNPVILHLHHTYYVRNTLPWDYPDTCFEVLCADCHNNVHRSNKILMYASHELGQSQHLTACNKCLGTGYLGHYYYYLHGVCFNCDGAGFEELKGTFSYDGQNTNEQETMQDNLPF